VPTRVTINTGPSTLDNRVGYSGFYVQDQWTLDRVTLSGALRFDHADEQLSRHLHPGHLQRPHRGQRKRTRTCPCRSAARMPGKGDTARPETDGVSYNDLTPRFASAWDLFGSGKTSVKFSIGKYLSGATISGIYADANPASRTVNRYTRTWTDVNGNRIADCDL
jgi:hypothetical protein